MDISYKVNHPISAQQFIDLLEESTLAQRRPTDDVTCMEGMVTNSNLMVTAWDGDILVGVARSMTDFHYACYLCDLAVRREYQKKGIGKELQRITQKQLGEKCKLVLVAAPDAHTYYGHIGYSNNPRCWVLGQDDKIS
ncbi:GNAT family N-acetyltransferase [Sulfurimonas sp. HSL3-7]|uniref:GNAT family N-acetyltransferase n=1 Tax=Sulfonitrofixus jiaomeiensis TaxID=3131938 RepID=UPI0031F84969